MYCKKIYLDQNQKDFAEKCGMHTHILSTVETELYNSTKETILKIAKVFWNEGLYFLPEGGFRMDRNIVQVFEGEDCFLKLQEDILRTCGENKEEVLYLGSSDKKSNKKLIEKEQEIYNAKIPCKYLISSDDNYILGPIEDYKQINKNYFLSNNVVVMYNNKIAFPSMIDEKGISTKTIIMNDKGISSQLQKYFYFLWKNGKVVQKSKVKQIVFKDN